MAAAARALSPRHFRYDPVIFVTVGTTMPFDELLAEVDALQQARVIEDDVICQSGQSKFRMRSAEQFVGRPSIADLIARADLVITHGGSTVIQLLQAKKPFIAFPNPRGAGDHQTSFLRELAEISDISWSPNVTDLRRLYAERRARGPATLRAEIPRAADVIREMLRKA